MEGGGESLKEFNDADNRYWPKGAMGVLGSGQP